MKNRGVFRLALTLLVAGSFSHSGRGQAPPLHRTGLVLATPDQLRGVPLASTPYSGAELPTAVDLSDNMPPPQNQGEQSSCVAWSVAYALKSYQERVEEHVPIVQPSGQIDARRVFSPAFVYNQINNGRDGGASFQDALNLVHDEGAAPWADMPYDPHDFTRRPNPTAQADAKRFRIDTWRQVNIQDTREIKSHVAGGYPVLVGVLLDESFMRAGPGFVWRATQGQPEGGHAMVIVGYDDRRGAFKLLNSWGLQWGENGYGWISDDHIKEVAHEAYVAKDARNEPPPQTTEVTPPPPVVAPPAPTPAPPVVGPPTPGPPVVTPPPPQPPPPPPTPQPTREAQFAITSVTHNAVIPDNPTAGYFMRLDGTLTIPGGMGSTDQVVISFWFDGGNGQKGQQVHSLSVAYTTVYGQAACGTGRYPIPPQGLVTTWAAWIPYSALDLPSGQWVQTAAGPVYTPAVTYLVAEPVLYIDNFGIKTGGLVPFLVNR